jgi:ParB family chromosome partitioning protein
MSLLEPHFELIPVDKVELRPGEFNVRRQAIEREVDQLAENVKRYGVLQPIIVNKVDDKYIVIAGQRRYLAAKRVGIKKIPAIVYEKLDKRQAIEISLSETIHRVDVGDADLMEAVTLLYEVYGNIKAVAEILGRSTTWVRKYIKMDKWLPDEVKKDPEIPTEAKVVIADIVKGTVDTLGREKSEELALRVAKEIKEKGLNVSDAKRLAKAIERVAIKKPESDVEDIVRSAEVLVEKEKAREREEKEVEPNTIILKLPDDVYEALGKASKVKMRDKEEVAMEYITMGLYRDGFLERA